MSEFVNLEVRDAVAIITLQRPPMNALNTTMQREIGELAVEISSRVDISAVVIYGGERVFAAGADVKEMADLPYQDMIEISLRLQEIFSAVANIAQPTIAAITGFALGGGCELAMMCDFIIAADNARFGQPEIKLGIMAGAGGTQRLPRAVGKAKAMDMALTGRMMDAQEAERAGLVSRVVAADKLMDEALGAALMICDYGQLSVMATKEAVNRSFESGLSDGLMFERRLFQSMFATSDQKEGMDAFLGKRKPVFTHR